ncbi:hypothetical protein [Methylobacterium marchantiae]|uniref:Ig-like domain-containing protein n=1 Tax=Methylobacterium marchantiae TaxID=600331 RepID=A0ABW3X0D6_9HYPH
MKAVFAMVLMTLSSLSIASAKDEPPVDLTPPKDSEAVRLSALRLERSSKADFILKRSAGVPTSWTCSSDHPAIVDVSDLGLSPVTPPPPGMVGFPLMHRFALSASDPGRATVTCHLSWFDGKILGRSSIDVTVE